MTELSSALAELFDFLSKRGNAPPTRNVCIFEITTNTAFDDRGRPLLRSNDLRVPAQYEERFSDLLQSGAAWINVSCLGVLAGNLVVSIEVARRTEQHAVRTSINYSGPPKAVIDNGWSSETLVIVHH